MPSKDRGKLVFVPKPVCQFGGQTFINVPIILLYDTTPLVEMVQFQGAGFGIEWDLFNEDGSKIGVVKGPRLFATEIGRKQGLKLEHFPNVTACQLSGRTLFELRRTEAAALKADAELFTPTGRFIRADESIGLFGNPPMQVGAPPIRVTPTGIFGPSVMMVGNTFSNLEVGIHIKSDGGVGLGCRRPRAAG